MTTSSVQYNINTFGEVPTFRPTMEEFSNFSEYVRSIEPQCSCGLAKIIPPEEWNKDFNYDDLELTIPAPITQYATGTKSGIYELVLVENESMSLSEFREAALKEKIPKSSKYDYDSLERTFWKNIRFNPPMYGADMSGSLFKPDVKYWNVAKLDSILKCLGTQLAGINKPYLYFGMWKAMFAWHVEDMNLFSINYLHFGEPKQWYVIPPAHGERFERIMQGYYPDQYKECSEFLRHKTFMVSPTSLMRNNIPVSKALQEKGQFIITFPYAFHAGFNTGFNCAESVNFAIDSWIESGKKAKACKCSSDTVKIDMAAFMQRYQMYKDGLLDVDKEEAERALAQQFMTEDTPDVKPQGGRMFTSISSRRMGARSPRKKAKMDSNFVSPDEMDEEANSSPTEEPPTEQHENDSEGEESEEKPKRKRSPRQLGKEETLVLENAFVRLNGVLDKEDKKSLAELVNWTEQGVYQWFRRKRLSGSPTKDELTSSPPQDKKSRQVVNALSPEVSQIAKKITISSPYEKSETSHKRPNTRQKTAAAENAAQAATNASADSKVPWFMRPKGVPAELIHSENGANALQQPITTLPYYGEL